MVIRIKLEFSSLSVAVKYFERMMSPYRCGDMARLAMQDGYHSYLSSDKALVDFNARHKDHIKAVKVNLKTEVDYATI